MILQNKQLMFSVYILAYDLHTIHIMCRSLFRKCLGFKYRDNASHMLVSNNIDTFDALIPKTCYTFSARLLASTNSVIVAITTNMWC